MANINTDISVDLGESIHESTQSDIELADDGEVENVLDGSNSRIQPNIKILVMWWLEAHTDG